MITKVCEAVQSKCEKTDPCANTFMRLRVGPERDMYVAREMAQ